MKLNVKMTVRQKIMAAICVVAVAVAFWGILTNSVWQMYILLFFAIGAQTLPLHGIEKSTQKLVGKLSRLAGDLQKVSHNVKYFSSTAEEVLKSGKHGGASDTSVDGSGDSLEVTPKIGRGLESLISEMDKIGKQAIGMKPSQLASVSRAVSRIGAVKVYTSVDLVAELSNALQIPTVDWKSDCQNDSDATNVSVVVVRESDFWQGADNLLAQSFFLLSAIILIEDLENSENPVVSMIDGFEEVAIIEVAYGIRIFYPVTSLCDAHYSKLFKYTEELSLND